jgi:branched-chain amino acid transport system ATP-binding protein
MLKVTDLKVKYGMIEAIKGISFEVRDGEIVTMIGANGAGKTTTMHAISGLVKAAEGSIKLDDTELTKTPANKIVGLGLAQVKAIVDYYGGMIYAKSSPGRGMGIYLHLPAERV